MSVRIQFISCLFPAGIGTPLPGLNIIVNDKDLGDNSRYVLAMRTFDPRVSNWFKIIPETALGRTTVLIRLVDNEGFDYDTGVTDVEFDIVAMYQDTISVSKYFILLTFLPHYIVNVFIKYLFILGTYKSVLNIVCSFFISIFAGRL